MRRARLNIKPNLGVKTRQTSENPKTVATDSTATKSADNVATKECVTHTAVENNIEAATHQNTEKTVPTSAEFDCTKNTESETVHRQKQEESVNEPQGKSNKADSSPVTNLVNEDETTSSKVTAPARRRHVTKVKPNVLVCGWSRNRQQNSNVSGFENHSVEKSVSQEEVIPDGKLSSPPLKSPKPSESKSWSKSENICSMEDSGLSVTPEKKKKGNQQRNDGPKTDGDSGARKDTVHSSEHQTMEKKSVKRVKRKVILVEGPFDRTKVTMKDLIYLNPAANPMRRVRIVKTKEVPKPEEPPVEQENKIPSEPAEVTDKPQTDEEESMLVPQVKIGPDGNIILNEETLTVEAAHAPPVVENGDIIIEEDSYTTYSSFRSRKRTRVWSRKETAKFYKALRAVGSDFEMMSKLFRNRGRTELKNKFKKEEKVNKELVDRAMTEPLQFDMSLFTAVSSDSEDEIEVKKERKPPKRKNKENKEAGNEAVKKKKMPRIRNRRKNKTCKMEPLKKCSDSEEEAGVANNTSKDVSFRDDVQNNVVVEEEQVVQEMSEHPEEESAQQTEQPLTHEPPEEESDLQTEQPLTHAVAPSPERRESEFDEEGEEEETIRTYRKTTRSGRQSRPTKRPAEEAEVKHTQLKKKKKSTKRKQEEEEEKDKEADKQKEKENTSKTVKSRKRNASGKSGGFVPNPGELISLDSVSNVDVSEIQPGQLVFVGSQRSDLDQQIIHVYMVSPSDTLQPVDSASAEDNVYHISLENCIEVETETENEGEGDGENVIYLGNHRIVCTPKKQQLEETEEVVNDSDSDIINISDDEIHISDEELTQIA